jgi:hypothetical protein
MRLDFSKTQRCFTLFEGRDDLVRSIDLTIKKLKIPAMIIGGAALPVYNYNRATEDIDLVLSYDDAIRLGNVLSVDNNFSFIGNNKFKHSSGIDINLCPTGVKAGDTSFPKVEVDAPGVHYVSLPLLLAMKIKAKRFKDRGDFAELVKRNNITLEYIEENVLPLLSNMDRKLAVSIWKRAIKE